MINRLRADLPRLGRPGSRAKNLHTHPDGEARSLRLMGLQRFYLLRWMGTMGAMLIGVGGLGAGALPVVENFYRFAPLGEVMERMLQTSSAIVFIGIGFLVLAWILMANYVGRHSVELRQIVITFIAWALPIALTAPLFTQDIYSYLAQGSIVAQGMDPYEAGPVQLLGTEHPLARSVPFIWANSPSPYGPVALGIAAAISHLTNDSIIGGIMLHRMVGLLGIAAAIWATIHLARRCSVRPTTAMWLGILNPLTLLHLVGGIHNESILLGFLLAGVEVGLRAVGRLGTKRRQAIILLTVSILLISCAGMVKVTGFIGLGFVGMALARRMSTRLHSALAITCAVVIMTVGLVASVALVTAATGINLGWITSQGGAATIRSWMSITTDIGVISGFFGMILGLGDHTEAILTITRTVGILIAGGFMVRMLFATFRGTIHPVGGLGVSSFVLVILFPVVHPWYMLWAILPLATWANRAFFRWGVVIYSAAMSFFVLPRGLALPADTVLSIYLSAAIGFAVLLAIGWWLTRRNHLISS